MRWTPSLLAAVAAASTAACATTLPDYDYASEPDPRTGEYVIGVSDVLRVDVWRNEEVSSEVRVRPDGTITLPLLGDIEAAGKTPSQLKTEIASRLGRWIRDEGAVVTVAVSQVNSYRFTVSGEVARAGVFTTDHYVTVVDAVALAGGFTRYAERDKVVVLRRARADGHLRKIPIDFRALATGDHNEMNIVLLPGDTVLVP